MIDDTELLRRYVREECEDAFRELVQRHIGFVYAVARRQVAGRSDLAEEVAQAVFTDLARKAPTLLNHPALLGWLFRSARWSSANLLRSERRRTQRESAAAAMQEDTSDSAPPIDWTRVGPAVDEALADLNDRDRDAVLLRYVQDLNFAEIGRRLRLGEDGARSRVNRALEKIRVNLTRQGITSTASGLAVALQQNAAMGVPASLAAKISAASLTASAAAPASVLASLFSMSKLSTSAAAVALAAGGTLLVVQQSANVSRAREIDALSREVSALDSLRLENRRLSTLASEAAALQSAPDELSRLQQQRDQAAGARSAAAALAGPAGPDVMVPIERLRNAPGTSPTSAIESALWAKDRLALDVLDRRLQFSPAGLSRARAYFAKLPLAVRAKFPDVTSAERMLAMTWGLTPPVAAVQLEQEVTASRDSVTLIGRFRYQNGHEAPFEMQFVPSPEGWRWLWSDVQIDQTLRLIDTNLAAFTSS